MTRMAMMWPTPNQVFNHRMTCHRTLHFTLNGTVVVKPNCKTRSGEWREMHRISKVEFLIVMPRWAVFRVCLALTCLVSGVDVVLKWLIPMHQSNFYANMSLQCMLHSFDRTSSTGSTGWTLWPSPRRSLARWGRARIRGWIRGRRLNGYVVPARVVASGGQFRHIWSPVPYWKVVAINGSAFWTRGTRLLPRVVHLKKRDTCRGSAVVDLHNTFIDITYHRASSLWCLGKTASALI